MVHFQCSFIVWQDKKIKIKKKQHQLPLFNCKASLPRPSKDAENTLMHACASLLLSSKWPSQIIDNSVAIPLPQLQFNKPNELTNLTEQKLGSRDEKLMGMTMFTFYDTCRKRKGGNENGEDGNQL